MYLFADLAEVLRHPFQAFPRLQQARRLKHGLVALAAALILPALVDEIAGLAPYRSVALPAISPDAAALSDLFSRWSFQERFRLPVYGVMAGLVLWLLAAVLVHAVARALQGRGGLAGYMKLVGYVALAGIITLPFTAADVALKAAGNRTAEAQLSSLVLLLSIAVFAWQNFLLVVAAHSHYGLSMERATAAVLGPVGALIVLLVVTVILVTVVLVVARPLVAG